MDLFWYAFIQGAIGGICAGLGLGVFITMRSFTKTKQFVETLRAYSADEEPRNILEEMQYDALPRIVKHHIKRN